MTAPLTFAAGPNAIIHKTGQRLDREETMRCRAYFTDVLAEVGASNERKRNAAEMIAQIDAAIAESFPNQQERVA